MNYYDVAKGLLYKHVIVETSIKHTKNVPSGFVVHTEDKGENLKFMGYLKVIDPISLSVILCHLDGRNISNIQQSTHPDTHADRLEAIVERDQLSKLREHPYFCKPPAVPATELISLQKNIISWFTKYRIPIKLIETSQELIVADCVRIKPPYQHETDYVCPTRVVMKRIKYMVDQSRNKSDNPEGHASEQME